MAKVGSELKLTVSMDSAKMRNMTGAQIAEDFRARGQAALAAHPGTTSALVTGKRKLIGSNQYQTITERVFARRLSAEEESVIAAREEAKALKVRERLAKESISARKHVDGVRERYDKQLIKSGAEEADAIHGDIRRSRLFRRRMKTVRAKRLAAEQRAASVAQTAAKNAQRESKDRFTAVMMGGFTPAMMGALGPAGFPFLNIGFAAMSGGITGAAIAGVATASGMSARALIKLARATMRVQDALIQAAESMKFVTDNYLEQKAGLTASKTFFGGIASVAREDSFGNLNRVIKENIESLTQATIYTTLFRGEIEAAALSMGSRFLEGFGGGRSDVGLARVQAFGLTNLLGAHGSTMFAQKTLIESVKTRLGLISKLEEMLENAREHKDLFKSRIESPEAMWTRIQTNFNSNQKTAEEQRERIIKALESQIEELKSGTAGFGP